MQIDRLQRSTPQPALCDLDLLELWVRCARDRTEEDLWRELVTRIHPRIRVFIQGTLRGFEARGWRSWECQELDLVQSTILRLVENDCAAMRRFSGSDEAALWAYLAVVSRSVVRDQARRQGALKRPKEAALSPLFGRPSFHPALSEEAMAGFKSMEREILAREIAGIGRRAIRSMSGSDSKRDQLIFQLYFFEGMSTSQIAACKAVQLSKTGIEKALNRVKDRVRKIARAESSAAVLS